MRIANRSMNAVQPRAFSQFTPARAASAPRAARTVDAFEGAPTAEKPSFKKVATEALGAAAESALSATLNKVVELLTAKLGALLEGLFAKLGGANPAPALPPAAPAPAPAPVTPAAPTPSAPTGGLQPTPLASDVPNQVGYVNTIQNPRVAPKSQFRDVVNQAIDAVRAKGVGIDPQDPDRITDYDTYHHGVVMELRARGYNAAYDGEELAVGRANDSFSEQFDISTSTGLVRRFYASWVSPAVWA